MLMEVMCLRLRRIAKMAGVEENDIDRLLVNPPEKIEIEVKYKIAVTVMELRFYTLLRFQSFLVDWLKACQYHFPQHQPFLLSLAWICHNRKQALPTNALI